jgi:hypothetical protein
MKKKEFNRLRALDEAIVDGLQAQLRELDERVAGLVLNARADARTIADFRRKEVEAGAMLDSFILRTRSDARTMAGLRRKIKEKDSLISKLRSAYREADAWLTTENSLKKKAMTEAENARAFARVEAEKARAFVRRYEDERNMILDRAVAAETKLDAAMVDVENKKAWYDMKLVGEVALRTQLEERIRELEGRS